MTSNLDIWQAGSSKVKVTGPKFKVAGRKMFKVAGAT